MQTAKSCPGLAGTAGFKDKWHPGEKSALSTCRGQGQRLGMTHRAAAAIAVSRGSSVFCLNLLLPPGSCTSRAAQGQEQVHGRELSWERSPQPLLREHPLDNLVHQEGMSPRRFLHPPWPGQQNSPSSISLCMALTARASQISPSSTHLLRP